MSATAKQMAFAMKLATERGLALVTDRLDSPATASQYITELLGLPRTPKPSAAGAVVSLAVDPFGEAGMYRNADGVIFKVQRSESGKLYAKRLTPIGGERLTEPGEVVRFEFQYDRGAVWSLTNDMRLSLADAKAFGIRYGICCVCGRTLKDAKSVAAGIGPICAEGL